ncbi:hypothetical protein [Geomonas ferrireducens]|uniref:hypothetical protein n=1 Tax=Geomonas ferrireducens TaxID=2570227 RepID=UPI0010A81A03|nr:hypothetical protein [Geomonas ferrireducens]
MSLQHQDEIYLPSWIGKLCGVLVVIVAFGIMYYGVVKGIINKEIQYTTKAGKVGTVKGFMAVALGGIYCGFGIIFLRLAALIFRSSKKN